MKARILVVQFVLAWSGWRYISIALGETYEALLSGLQGALWELRGVPARIRQDNLSAATHELVETSGRTLTKRFAQVVDHYDFEASRIQPGEAHENGVAEKANDLLKTALRQALILRGSRDFPTVEDYLRFARAVVDERFHRHRVDELAHERTVLKPLPEHRLRVKCRRMKHGWPPSTRSYDQGRVKNEPPGIGPALRRR